MKNNFRNRIVIFISVIFLFFNCVKINASASDHTVDEIYSLIDGIVTYKLDSCNINNIQEWIDGPLTDGAGTTSEWYAMTLAQYGGYNMYSYRRALENYADNNNVSSATGREKIALALIASGSTDSFISRTIDDSIDQLGLMSWIYGLHLLNNGFSGNNYDVDTVINKLLDSQFDDGGWAIMGQYGDIDVTAMTITALSPYYDRQEVEASVNRGIEFLSDRQNDDGGYSSFGTVNPESAAQVLLALSSIGIDCQTDVRFIKGGNNIIDSILSFRNSDGSFSHVLGGQSNESATVQSMYSLVSYVRMHESKSPLWVMDDHTGDSSNIKDNNNSDTDNVIHNNGKTTEKTDSVIADDEKHESVSVTTVTDSKSVSSTNTVCSTFNSTSANTNSLISSTHLSSNESNTYIVSASTTTVSVIATMTIVGNDDGKTGYKPVAIFITLGAAVLISAVLLAAGKKHPKNFIAVGVTAVAIVGVIWFTDIQTAHDYYNGTSSIKEDSIGTVTMSIHCDTIKDKNDSEYIPKDGIILDCTSFDIQEGDTVYDILNEAAQVYGIQVENSGSAGNAHGMVYISAINYLYEMQYGELSGWIYHVNGEAPSVNCGEYVLKDGDIVEWLYTCELGYDLGDK